MSRPRLLCALVLALSLASVAGAAPIYVYDGGVGHGTWQDVNKSGGPGDYLLCWAVAGSDALAWTGWQGWNSVTSAYISSATDIFATFNAAWSNRTGTAMYAYEWWMTTQTQTKLPGGYLFDSQGLGFYPTQGDLTSGSTVWNYVQSSQAPTQIYDYLGTYIGGDRGIVASFHVGASTYGAYDHDVTVWGWDPTAHEIYLTDGDDGMSALRTYTFHQDGTGQVWIDNYTNTYTNPVDVEITRLARLNLNDSNILPVGAGSGPGPAVPEPASILLLGTGLSGLFLLRKRARKS